MQFIKSFFAITIIMLFFSTNTIGQNEEPKRIDFSVDPVSFFMNGFSIHAGYSKGIWHLDLEAFSLKVPSSIHGNEGFTAKTSALELKIDRYFNETTNGFFASAGLGISKLKVTETELNKSQSQLEYSAGVRGGYRWDTPLGNLYITPLAGLDIGLDNEDITVGGNTFENDPLQPYATVNIGWYFSVNE